MKSSAYTKHAQCVVGEGEGWACNLSGRVFALNSTPSSQETKGYKKFDMALFLIFLFIWISWLVKNLRDLPPPFFFCLPSIGIVLSDFDFRILYLVSIFLPSIGPYRIENNFSREQCSVLNDKVFWEGRRLDVCACFLQLVCSECLCCPTDAPSSLLFCLMFDLCWTLSFFYTYVLFLRISCPI